MAKTRNAQPRIRKSVLMFGGAAIAVAVLAVVLMSFLGGGGGGEIPTPTTAPSTSQPSVTDDTPPAPASPAGLRPGGRDPFRPVVNVQPAAPNPS